jgi:hypothetical protein
MYFMLECYAPLSVDRALIDYTPDVPSGEIFPRDWAEGKKFPTPPPTPVIARIPTSQAGTILEMNTATLPLMSRRLTNALTAAGVSNIDFYEAEIHDEASGTVIKTHLAFNLIGTVAAADLKNSEYSAPGGPLISVDFDSLVIDESKTHGAKMFRLAEAVMGIVVHESVKQAIEAAGIDTLRFVDPVEWIS